MNIHLSSLRSWGRVGLPLSLIAAAFIWLTSCNQPNNPTQPNADGGPNGAPFFEDVTEGSGISLTYQTGEEIIVGKDEQGRPFGNLSILESVGGGAGLIDYDGDGLYDIFIPGGGSYTGEDHRTIIGKPCKLYKNLGNFKFKDVTEEVGLDKIDFYTHGVAVADYNNDGYPDLLVTGWGRLALFRNDPVDPNDLSKGRKFTDVTRAAHLDDHMWSTSAGWADFDGDGHVDLYVAHYLDWHFGKNGEQDLVSHPPCFHTEPPQDRDVCPPDRFLALPHVLYRNNGDSTFTDVSKSAGLRVPRKDEDYPSLHAAYVEEARQRLKGKVPDGELEAMARDTADDACKRLRDADAAHDYAKGMGVVILDIDGDGKPDVYVASDQTDKLLYVNRSTPNHILFEELALSAGVARDDNGNPEGSMGIDAADWNGTLRPSLWCTNYEKELHSLYTNECKGDRIQFTYATQQAGIASMSRFYVGWGTGFADFDLDGLEDLFISNGHVYYFPTGVSKRRQYPILLRCVEGNHGRRFLDVTKQHGGSYCAAAQNGRGVAFGDLNNDGRVDMVLSRIVDPVVVLKNVAGQDHHWIGFKLSRKDHCDAVGAKIILEAGGKKQARFAKSGGSYLSSNDPRHVFGLGKGDKIDKVTVTWPDLHEQTWEGLAVDRYWELCEETTDARPAKSP